MGSDKTEIRLGGIYALERIAWDSELEEANYLTINQLSKARNLVGATLNADLQELVKKKYPHLIEEPQEDVGSEREK